MPEERKIQNSETLAVSELRKTALEIAEAGLWAIDTDSAIRKSVSLDGNKLTVAGDEFNLEEIGRIFVVGIGKCSLEAAGALEAILGDKIAGGIVVDVRDGKLGKIKTYTGTHPFPSEKNVGATKEIIRMISGLKPDDLVIFVVSGGGSTLLCQPPNFTYREEESLLRCLFKVGADIREVNTIRKHMSLARGGYLAKYAYPAKVVSIIFSDIPGENLEFVASGPTALDTTTAADARKIFEKYARDKKCGVFPDYFIETPKEEKYFEKVRNVVIVSNEVALESMASRAKSQRFKVSIYPIGLKGEAKEIGKRIAEELNRLGAGHALLYGGETTVAVDNGGRGGRNLELALSALCFIKEGQILVSVASDGRDNTDFAGAIADTITEEHAVKLKLEPDKYLASHSSYDFFERTGDYIFTGDTGSNVADFVIALHQ